MDPEVTIASLWPPTIGSDDSKASEVAPTTDRNPRIVARIAHAVSAEVRLANAAVEFLCSCITPVKAMMCWLSGVKRHSLP